MAEVEGLNLRGSRWYVRINVPQDLVEAYGRARINVSLDTGDRREAPLQGTIARARWLADFEAKRRERSHGFCLLAGTLFPRI